MGKSLDDAADDKIQKLLGKDVELSTPGDNYDKTKERKEALEIVEDPANRGLNARQIILKYKQPHASGENPNFPSKEEIDNTMGDFESDYFVEVFGDGSVTTPPNGGPH